MAPHTLACEFHPVDHVRRLRDDELRELGWLSLGVAHDLNNLLTVILGAASMASDMIGPTIQQEMDTIDLACLRGRELLQSLTGEGKAHPAPDEAVDLNRIAREVFKHVSHVTRVKVGFLLDLAPDVAPILGDETELECALINILINSLDAMPLGGSITLRSRNEDSDKVTLTVQDTGEGMSAEAMARATEPFFTTKPLGKGNGLGLARVREIVEAHDGTLAISSKKGLGTIIRIVFPRADLGRGDLHEGDNTSCPTSKSSAAPLGESNSTVATNAGRMKTHETSVE